MPTTTTKTVKSSGGDYTSLSAWEAGRQADLVAGDAIEEAECYAFSDTTRCDINGWTTDATRYIRIYAKAGERHAGSWNTAKYNLVAATAANGGVLRIQEEYTRIEYLQVQNTKASPGEYDACIYFDVRGFIDGCITRDGDAGINLTVSNAEVRNCLCYGGLRGCRSVNSAAGANTWLNCTLIGTTYGAHVAASGVYAIMKNCYAHGGTIGFYPNGGVVTGTNLIASDTSATNNTNGGGKTNCTDSVAHSTANFTNVTGGSEDYHIVTGSALKDAGVDLSGTFTNDFDGTTRSGTFDVGADEFVAGGAFNMLLASMACGGES